MAEDIKKIWAGGVCVRNNNVLLIHRINNERLFNKEYFIFPGKEVSQDESIEQALVEEFEKIGLTIKTTERIYEKEGVEETEYYYLCEHLLGEPTMTTEDSSESQFFTPLWIPINELDELMIHPESIKEVLQNKIL